MKRRLSREKALQSLYQSEFHGLTSSELMDSSEEVLHTMDQEDLLYTNVLVRGTMDMIPELDAILQQYVKGWKIERLARVDRNILRLGTYEMVFRDDIPPKVAVNEAVELAKAFGDQESSKFVNGVLGQILQNLDQVKAQYRVEAPTE
jgi:N utilization substance protein B